VNGAEYPKRSITAPASVAPVAQPTFHAMLLKLVARARRPCGSTSMVNAWSKRCGRLHERGAPECADRDQQPALAAERDQERQRQQLEPTAERSFPNRRATAGAHSAANGAHLRDANHAPGICALPASEPVLEVEVPRTDDETCAGVR
jgi:hypothetical protein